MSPNPEVEAKRLLSYLGLLTPELLNRPVTDLSVGQQQRVAAARVLMGAPEVIIADEPTSSLDASHRRAFINLLFEECEKMKSTLVFVSHDTPLARTGTPVDRAVFVSLDGIDAIHAGMDPHDQHAHDPLAVHADIDHHHLEIAHSKGRHTAEADDHHGHKPKAITAFYVGLTSRSAALSVQRRVNGYKNEPLSAILPAIALQELWGIVGVVEKTLLAVSGFVVLVGLSGMLVAIMTSLNERRREMAILRAVGARPMHVLSLIVGEAGLVTLIGISLGVAFLYGLLAVAQPLIATRLGIFLAVERLAAYELLLMGIIFVAGILIRFVPGHRIYRMSLADGMAIKVPQLMKKHGVKTFVGSDMFGWDNWRNALVNVAYPVEIPDMGYTSLDCMKMSTSIAGEALLELSEPSRNPFKIAKLGVVEEGAWADVLIWKGDPSQNVKLVLEADNLLVAMKDGTAYKNLLVDPQHESFRGGLKSSGHSWSM